MDKTKATHGEDLQKNFPICEIVKFSDKGTSNQQPSLNSGNETLLSRSNRNMSPPKCYGRGFFIDVIDHLEEKSGSASNPIVLNNNRKE